MCLIGLVTAAVLSHSVGHVVSAHSDSLIYTLYAAICVERTCV